MLGQRYPAIEKRVAMITQSLNDIFEREHTLNLDRLKTISKRDARAFLRELPDVHPFVEAYVMLYGFDGHAVPLDDEMLSYLRSEEIVEEQIGLEEVQRFVEHHIKHDESHAFFVTLRAATQEAGKGKKKVKA